MPYAEECSRMNVEITREKVASKIITLGENKSPAVDNIVPIGLKRVANDICASLCAIFIKSLDTGQVPDWSH